MYKKDFQFTQKKTNNYNFIFSKEVKHEILVN